MKKEGAAALQCEALVQEAFLGTALLNVSSENTRVALKFRTYNQGREIQEDLIRSMVERMKLGQCSSLTNPLIIAVDVAKIDPECLSIRGADEDQPGALKKVRFTTAAPASLEVLAGMHRVRAARRASSQLRTRLGKLEKQLGVEPNTQDPSEEHNEENPFVRALGDELREVKDVIELVENWPVRFYDMGKPPFFLQAA